MQRQEDKTKMGFPFLEKVSDSDLRAWKEFTETPLYLFLKVHYEKERREVAEDILRARKYIDDPILLAEQQGRLYGHREVLDGFFMKVKAEHERRTSRNANAGAGTTR